MSDGYTLEPRPHASPGEGAVRRMDKEGTVLGVKLEPKVEFSTGSTRSDATGKGRFDLLPYEGLRRIAIRFEGGAIGHGDRNWEKGMPIGRILSSAARHIAQAIDGQTDEDHLAAAGWGVMAAMHMQREVALGRVPADLDDIPKRGDK
jgi:hypothetical protein